MDVTPKSPHHNCKRCIGNSYENDDLMSLINCHGNNLTSVRRIDYLRYKFLDGL